MRVVKHSVMIAALISVALLFGCSSQPKDPFKEWGAAQNYGNYVPETAQTVAKGVGKLTYTTPGEGTLYLIDDDVLVTIKGVQKPMVLITGGVPTGWEVTFDPQTRRVQAKGRGEGVKLRNVDPTHTHELRFDPEPRP
jgi:hypothetical protein